MDKMIKYGILGIGLLGIGYIAYEYLTSKNSSINSLGTQLANGISQGISQGISGISNLTNQIPKQNVASNGKYINLNSYNPSKPVSITPYGSTQSIIATPISTSNQTQTQRISLSGNGTTQLSNELHMNLSTITMPKSTTGYSGNTTAGLVNALSEEQTAYNLLGVANVQKYGYRTTTNSNGQVVYSLG